MTFLAPWALWAAGAVSAAVVALHILASKNPKVTALPTARFIPDVPLRATARALRLSDVLLMLLRVAVVMLVGVAFARPELTRARRAVGRVVMVSATPGFKRYAAMDSAMQYYRDGDVAFVFDSAAYRLSGRFPLLDVSAETFAQEPRHSISAALVAGMRAASLLRGEADSVELVLVSRFTSEEFDAATSAIRAAWPGRVRVVRFEEQPFATYREQVFNEVRGSALEDPLRASLSFAARLDTGRIKTDSVRIDRGSLASIDTTWTQYGLTLVRWPANLDSSGYTRRARLDTAGAVVARSDVDQVVVVSPFARVVDPPVGRVVARWADGSPAATERKMMNGCVRDVAIPIARSGDLALRESMRRLVAVLSRQCYWHAASTLASDSTLAQLRGTGPLVATRALDARSSSPSRLATWLLVAALALLLVEPLLRRQRATT
jgi:hypothetical protein